MKIIEQREIQFCKLLINTAASPFNFSVVSKSYLSNDIISIIFTVLSCLCCLFTDLLCFLRLEKVKESIKIVYKLFEIETI